jgi:molecular chaperone GrpE
MEHDPTQQAAAEEAAAPAEAEPTDGGHAAADDVPVAPPDADGAAGAAAGAAGAAGVAQAEADAPEADAPEPDEPDAPRAGAPRPAAAPAEPDYRDQYLRAMAELDNVRKRARRDVSQAEARGIAKLARELLPAIDNFGRALDAAEAQPENRDHHLTDGIRLVQNELLSALARVGIEPDSPKGEPFDPHCHEAIAQQPVEGAVSGTIVEVYSQGYRYHDDVLRPAKVVVAA